jgi:hypothetical protein
MTERKARVTATQAESVKHALSIVAVVMKRPALGGATSEHRSTAIQYRELQWLKLHLENIARAGIASLEDAINSGAMPLTEDDFPRPMGATPRANKVGNVVRDLDDKIGWRVEWCDRLTSPRFNSKGAAEAYLNGLFLGRKPEYSEGE